MSWDTNGKGLNKVRWDRVFTTVSGEGQPSPTSNTFVFLAAYFVGEFYGRKAERKKLVKSLKSKVISPLEVFAAFDLMTLKL
jgi:hypothetical protein